MNKQLPPTIPLMSPDRLLARFLRYVQIDTTAGEGSSTYPSSPGQLVLGKLLTEELQAMGLADVQQDQFGLIWATIPSTVRHTAPVVAV